MNNMLRSFINVSFFVTAVIAGFTGLASAAVAAPSEAGITAEQFREDLDFMQRTLTQIHPDLRFSSEPEAVVKAMHALANDIGAPVTQDEAWRRLATLNPLFADGHLFVGFDWRGATKAHLGAGGTLFPYEVALSDGNLFIRGLLGGADTPLSGARIVAINGEPVDKVTSTLLNRLHGETPVFRANLLAQRWWFYHWKMFGSAANYRLTIARGDKIVSIDTPGSVQTPLVLLDESDVDRQFRFAFQPDGSAMLTINSFAPIDREKFLGFTRDAFIKLRQVDTRLLVIDIRANGGGDDATWLDGLMPYLATSAYRTGSTYKKKVVDADAGRGERPGQLVNGSIDTWRAPQPDNPLLYNGKTIVTIGPGTYSSAVLFANVMHDFCFAALEGVGGAARRTQSGGVRPFILPNSKLTFWVPRFVLDPPVITTPGALLGPGVRDRSLCSSRSQVTGQ